MAVSVSSSGVVFPASQSASGTANVLDDYEEGTWTLTCVAGSGSWTTNTSTMTYTKTGRSVTLTGLASINGENSASGHMQWTGCPFTAGSGEQFKVPVSYWFNGISAGHIIAFAPELSPNGTTIEVYQSNGNGGLSSDVGDFGDNGYDFRIGFTYFGV